MKYQKMKYQDLSIKTQDTEIVNTCLCDKQHRYILIKDTPPLR